MGKDKIQIAIIDYEMGNLFSVKKACEHVGLEGLISSDKDTIMKSDGIILPGVGAFGDAMDNLKRLDLISPIKDFIGSGKSFMGICLGLQLLMSESNEFGHHEGLDVIKGTVVRFPNIDTEGRKIKVPQVGWNRIYSPYTAESGFWEASPLSKIADSVYMYFVHSFYAVPSEKSVILSCTNYESTEYASSILHNNVFACQFHPEKSENNGLKIYENWAKMVENKRKESYE